jgi:hypothetical protein
LVVYSGLQLYVQAINWQVLEHKAIYQAVAGSFINFDITGMLSSRSLFAQNNGESNYIPEQLHVSSAYIEIILAA